MWGGAPYSGKAIFSLLPVAKFFKPSASQLSPVVATIDMLKESAMAFATDKPILKPVKLPGPL